MIDAMKIAGRATALALLLAGACATHADAARQAPSVRVRLFVDRRSGDMLVYSIPLHIGGTTLEGLLDTGSVPTLVLKGRVPRRDAQPTGQTLAVTYGGTRTFGANVVSGPITIGTAASAVGFGVVNSVSCVPAGSDCATAGDGPRDAFFGGRLPAIVGARIIVGPYPVTSVFRELGVHRFVLTAPRQGEGDGSLELNPTSNATAGFVPIYNDTSQANVSGAVQGCLRNKTNGASFCGVVLMDSGRTGIEIFPPSGSTQSQSWGIRNAAQLEFTGPGGAEIAGVDFPVGADSATRVTFAAPGQYAEPVIYVGQLPYIGLSVLTDFDAASYAVAPRSAARDGVTGHVP